MAPPLAADNFAQRQSITTAIHQICLYYPPNTCLRELLQNADDAGASEIEYVLDTTSYGGKPLLSDGLEDFQGPALLVRNNSVFRDEDFRSLSSISDSVKRNDPAATGKFGQGFNAVYHWTDGPWVWSRNWLLILDPHEWWSQHTGQAGGPRWDVVENRDSVEIQNHLKTFSKLGLDPREPLNESVIRIPLRSETQAEKSKIFPLNVDVSAIRQALEEFGQELKEGGMLFLKHIRKIVVRIDDDVLLKAETYGTNKKNKQAREQLPANFKSLYVSKSNTAKDICPVFELAMKYTERGASETRRYAVQHVMLCSSGDVKMDVWARNEKLFPWAAVAALLEGPNAAEAFHGRLFTILRLPMPTNLPVHIHGLFCMAPDRGRLEPTRSPDDPHTKWNRLMFASCVGLAWIKLLAHRNTVSWKKEMFAFWPRPNIVAVETVQLWDQLDDNVIDLAIDSNREVWNASHGRCVSLDKGFFGIKGREYTEYGSVLAQVHVPAVYLEGSLFKKVQKRAKLLGKEYKLLVPSTVRRFLRQKSIPVLSVVQASAVLEFCLLDAIKNPSEEELRSAVYKELQDIPLWPTVSGVLSISNDKDLLLPQDEVEMQLFANSRASSTVNISKLSPPVQQLLLKDIKNIATVMRFHSLNDLILDWPVMYPIHKGLSRSSADSIQRPLGLDALLGKLWAWIVERFQEGQRLDPAHSKALWLVPTNDGRIRLYTPGPESLPLLVIVQKDQLYEFIMSATAKMPAETPPVLSSSILPGEAVTLFRSNRELRVATNSTCVDETNDFVDWLVAGERMLSAASDEDKEVLLSHLETITRDSALQGGLSPTLTTLMRRLPLYSRRSCNPPFKAVGYAKRSLDAREQIFEAPSGLPPLPDMSNVLFFEPQSQVEKAVVKRLKALPDVSNKDLLTQHFLPWIGTVTSCDAALSLARMKLVDWIMKIAPTTPRSAAWQADVFGHAIIPLPIEGEQIQYRCIAGMVDPDSSLAPLYGAGENVFPCPHFFAEHKDVLFAYGLISEPKWDTPLERARYFAQHEDEVNISTKIETLLTLRVPQKLGNSIASITEIRTLKWIPSISVKGEPVLLAPTECRGVDDRHLIDLVWGITPFSMEPSWKKVLGWDESIPTELLLRQLDGCLSNRDYEKAHKVLLNIDPAKSSGLLSRRCILGRSGAYFTPEKIFLTGSHLARRPLAPHLDEVDGTFARQYGALLAALDVRSEPSIQDLQDVQRALTSVSKGRLSPSDVLIAISALEIACNLKYDLTGLLVPDTTSTLREMADIVPSSSPTTGITGSLNFTHHGIGADLADHLGLEDSLARAIRLQIDLDSDNEEDYVPGEKLTTVISDTLGRYSIASTFNEFLANADDAHATTIVWTLDECSNGAYASAALLTTELKPFQGAALFVHNDGVFSKQDFAGFKDIGQGGKHGDANSTGMFGRGSQSMYHFTDLPMLVSARSFLVIDPQQMVLPIDKHRKRKVGTKLSFPTVRSLALDQLSPFDGLHEFGSTTEYYDGTIFRFPLREYGTKTELKDTKERVDLAKVRSLLEDYFATARTALLFLRHVESIEFYIRGQQAPQWAVSAKRRPCEDNDTFRLIEIESSQAGSRPQLDRWCIGLRGVKEIPTDVRRSGSSSGKLPECGVAALLIQGKVTKIENGEGVPLHLRPGNTTTLLPRPSIVRQTIFCRLPTSHESSLPISFHASFAVTGDRRTIALEKSAENASWNQWLLKERVSALYMEILRYLAPRLGNKAFEFWPTGGTFSSSATLSGVLARAFWDKVADQGHELGDLLPLVAQETALSRKDSVAVFQPTQKTTSLIEATFDFLPKQTSERLRFILMQLIPDLVRPPKELWLGFDSVSSHQARQVDLECLSRLFKVEDNCKLLEAILANIEDEEGKRTTMALLLETMVPDTAVVDTTAISALSGCRIIPRPQFDHSLGTLILNPQPDASWNLLPTSEEQDLFAFATETMVNIGLPWKVARSLAPEGKIVCDPIENLRKAKFNIRQCEIGDLGNLLASSKSPTSSAVLNDDLGPWLLKFWQYFNTKSLTIFQDEEYADTPFRMTVAEFLTKANLQDQKIYRTFSDSGWHYITNKQFESEPCIVRPLHEEHRKICDQIQGLIAVDRACIPFRLRENEDSLQKFASFKRFLEALEKLEKGTNVSAKTIIGDCLTQESKDAMRELALNYLSSTDQAQASVDAIIRRLPIWRRQERSSSSPHEHIAGEDAVFCGHEEMLMPWISNLCSFVEPHLVRSAGSKLSKLGLPLLTREKVWHLIKGDVPKYLNTKDSRQQYVKFLQYLARWENSEQWQVTITGRIAPNGNSLICETNTLYDHQDEIFSAAFREQRKTRFLHVDMQGRELRSFWLSLGLRVRSAAGFMSHEYYLECALAINGRWDNISTTPVLGDDCEVVSAYLGRNGPPSMTFESWPHSTWTQIAAIPMFRVRDVPADEGIYRQDQMNRIAAEKLHRSFGDTSKLDHVRIMWSQACFLKDPPGDFAYKNLPRGGKPTAAQVFEHLTFLTAIIIDINQEDLPEYLRDVQACYDFLQGDLDATKSINGILQARIWLNIDTTQVDLVLKGYFESSLTSAEKLCLKAGLVDPFPLKGAKNFLVPYEKLLVGLGCQTVIQPTSAASPPSSDSRELSLASAMAQMRTLRDQGLLVDVTFEVGGQRKPAHKIVLAAVSDFCKAQFTGLWGRLLEHKATIHLKDLSYLSLSQMVDFAYTGDVEWPELKDSSDSLEVEGRLTELLDLLDATNMWLLPRLHNMTENLLACRPYNQTYIRVDTVYDVKERAERARAPRLVQYCEDFLAKNQTFASMLREGDQSVEEEEN